MGRCEKQMLFEHIHGNRRSEEQQRDSARGLLAHEQFHKEGLAASAAHTSGTGRCFIASCVFGGGWQTVALRGFRDEFLRPKPWGRWLIKAYYRVAPGVCITLNRWPTLQAPVRAVLGALALGLRRRWRGGRE